MSSLKYYVNMDSVVSHIRLKLETDTAILQSLLDTNEGRHNFEEQVRVLQEIQASVRAIDVMLGRCDVHGEETDSSDFTIARLSDDLQSAWTKTTTTPPVDVEIHNSVEQALLDGALDDPSEGAGTEALPTFLRKKPEESTK